MLDPNKPLTHWLGADYEMAMDEITLMVEMLNQIAVNLQRPVVCINDFITRGFVGKIDEVIGKDDWSKANGLVSVSDHNAILQFPPTTFHICSNILRPTQSTGGFWKRQRPWAMSVRY